VTTTGLRERKKQQTRELISDVATQLFAANGFERTTISEVAAAADVAKMTVTNYFPLKEDLVFDRHEDIAGLLAAAVRSRPTGRGVLGAVRTTYLEHLDDRSPILGFIGLPFAQLVQSSPALLRREHEIFTAQEARLTETLAAEFAADDADLRPRVAACQLAGIFRVLYYEGRRRLVSGQPTGGIVKALRTAARESYAGLEPGLPVDYR